MTSSMLVVGGLLLLCTLVCKRSSDRYWTRIGRKVGQGTRVTAAERTTNSTDDRVQRLEVQMVALRRKQNTPLPLAALSSRTTAAAGPTDSAYRTTAAPSSRGSGRPEEMDVVLPPLSQRQRDHVQGAPFGPARFRESIWLRLRAGTSLEADHVEHHQHTQGQRHGA